MSTHIPNQADRDAAASTVGKTGWSREQYRSGKRDKTAAVQSFAAHRLNSHKELAECLHGAELWLTAALECKDWHWDGDQFEAATECRDRARAALSKYQDEGAEA